MDEKEFMEAIANINNAIDHLITGKQFLSENETIIKPTKIINRAIQLQSLEVDTALLMIANIVRCSNTGATPTYRVAQLLQTNKIGKSLVSILNNYNWAYQGFMTTTEVEVNKLTHSKVYHLPKFDLYTGFTDENDLDSFVVKMIKNIPTKEDW